MLFLAKPHKIKCPLWVVVSENENWHKFLAEYSTKNLNLLNIDGTFKVKNSEDVI